MEIQVLKSKIHRVRVTQAELHYVGSVTLDPDLMEAVCLNGPAARKVQIGDMVIIVSYAVMDFEEAKSFKPSLVFPDKNNKVISS